MDPVVKKFHGGIYQIDVLMEGTKDRLACYYIDSKDPILIEVGPSSSFPYLISGLESIGIKDINRSAITHLHLDHVGGIGHMVELYKNHFVYIHELGLKHLPNPEKLWNAVASIYTEEWLMNNWGIIKPIPLSNIKKLSDGDSLKLEGKRSLKAIYSPGHAKHHYTFYDGHTGTIFMGDTLGLIYPHGNNVQPNLPPPDFNKEILFETLEKIYSLELRQLAIAHFGIHSDPYSLIEDAYKSVEEWITIVDSVNEKSNYEASILLKNWVKNNYESLGVEESVIEHYLDSTNFEMQVSGIRNYLNSNNNS